MVFISFYFYLFLAAVIIAYYIIPVKFRWYILLLASFSFYWYMSLYSWQKFFALTGTALVCWFLSKFMERGHKRRNICLIISVSCTAIPLLIVKESPFITVITHKTIPDRLFVPVGIAFYSMQLIAYVVDVYNNKIESEKNCLKFLLFAGWFPQIIQGPIPRYAQLSHQLSEGHKFDERKFVKGFMLILWGFFLKLCVADKAGVFVDNVFDNFPTYRGSFVLVAGILYSFQLYADFLACTSLAQGISELFCIDLADNFNHPYFSTSVKDFWHRWHISLSTWLKDYIYIPLGGNRKGKARKYLNLLATFAVSGIWHGSGYKFLFWGLLHGLYQILGEIMIPFKNIIDKSLYLNDHPYFRDFCKKIFTFFIVMLAWIIFRADHLTTGLSMIKSIFTVYNPWIFTNDGLFELGLCWKEFILLIFCLLTLLTVSRKQENGIKIRDRILECNLFTRWFLYIGTIIFILIFGTYGYGFNAKDFIYGGF